MKNTLRIKKNRVFKYVLKKGKYISSDNITVHISNTKYKVEDRENINNFYGVCVSKKNGNSVNRNKLKRWAREVYKIEEENIKLGYNIVVLYKKSSNVYNLNFNKVYDEFIYCCNKLGIYDKK